MAERFEAMLRGGRPNSLGRTARVVELVLADRQRLEELVDAYRSDDELVRLRVSNAMKRVAAEQPDWLLPFVDRLIGEVAVLDQPSAQWTLAQLFDRLADELTKAQRREALRIMKRNLERSDDWIVLTQTMQTLARWSDEDAALRRWLAPRLERLAEDPRRSVSGRARKLAAAGAE